MMDHNLKNQEYVLQLQDKQTHSLQWPLWNGEQPQGEEFRPQKMKQIKKMDVLWFMIATLIDGLFNFMHFCEIKLVKNSHCVTVVSEWKNEPCTHGMVFSPESTCHYAKDIFWYVVGKAARYILTSSFQEAIFKQYAEVRCHGSSPSIQIETSALQAPN